MSIKEPAAVVWEDSWSSKSLGTKANQYLGTLDREDEVKVHILGKELQKGSSRIQLFLRAWSLYLFVLQLHVNILK